MPTRLRLWVTILALLVVPSCGDKKSETNSTAITSPPPVEKQEKAPNVPLLSPKESADACELPPEYDLEVVLSEPQVQECVLTAWDGNGRLYVAEMLTFMQDIDGNGQLAPKSRILRFEDTNGDGQYDARTVFADKLVLPRAILPLDDRILIRETNSLDIVALRDSNGDGIADERRIVFKSQEEDRRNLEHQDANLLWNIDNWIYTCQGGKRFKIDAQGQLTPSPLITELNQWGLTQDNSGQLYYADNSTPARDYQQPLHYWNYLKNDLIEASERALVGASVEPQFLEVWPLVKADDAQGAPEETRDDGTLKEFSCACGQHIYRGDALPGLRNDYFICESVGRLIRRAKIRSHKGQRVLVNAHPKSEFLRSRDYLFRPVHLDTGPDGHLYIVDMNRGIIQEAAWLAEGFGIRKVIQDRGLAAAKMRGRILRVVQKGKEYRPAKPKMLDETSAQLVRHLTHPNGWWRDTAQKLIVLRQDKSAVAPLRKLLKTHASPLARLHALWTLSGLEALTLDDIKLASSDKSPLVIAAAMRNLEPKLRVGDEAALALISGQIDCKDPKVLQQCILSLGAAPKALAHPIANQFIEKHFAIPIVRLAAMTAFKNADLPVYKKMFEPGFFEPLQEVKGAMDYRQARAEWWFSIRYQFAAQRKVSKYRDLDAEGERVLHRGQMRFKQTCSQCHGLSGSGEKHKGKLLGANLGKSDRILGNPEGAVRILLHGLIGEVDGQDIGVMIPFATQTDEFIADILTSLRWPLRRGIVTPAFVAEQRKLTEGRRKSWTIEELRHSCAPKVSPDLKWEVESNCGGDLIRPFDNNLLSRFASVGNQKPGMMLEIRWNRPLEMSYLVLDSADSKNGFATAFKVQVATNDGPWQEVGRFQDGSDPVQEVKLKPVVASRMRIVLTASKEVPWCIHELHLYGLAPK